jgi:hypothetical protein
MLRAQGVEGLFPGARLEGWCMRTSPLTLVARTAGQPRGLMVMGTIGAHNTSSGLMTPFAV